ncbi:MAG TPA: hypothetical protein VM307_12160 [Egibacteraceae bacterium]|nr:hypothetical protein [Egibacteraceae bacterium]
MLRRRLEVAAAQGLAEAADRFGGDDLEAVCDSLATWRRHGQRELPWLAGPVFSSLAHLGVGPPTAPAASIVERFLVGDTVAPADVRDAVAQCIADAGEEGPPLPPDMRGALVDSVERFFDLLAGTYRDLRRPVINGHRRTADDTIDQWRPRLDAAARDVAERADVVAGRVQRTTPRARGAADRPGVALGFAVVAVVLAAVVLFLVSNGWPMSPVRFDL